MGDDGLRGLVGTALGDRSRSDGHDEHGRDGKHLANRQVPRSSYRQRVKGEPGAGSAEYLNGGSGKGHGGYSTSLLKAGSVTWIKEVWPTPKDLSGIGPVVAAHGEVDRDAHQVHPLCGTALSSAGSSQPRRAVDAGKSTTYAQHSPTHDSLRLPADHQDMPHRRRSSLILTLVTVGSLALGACGDSSDRAADATTPASDTTGGGSTGGDGVTEALEAQTPAATVEVPSADGATTITDYASGASSYEPSDPQELAQILAIIGTDADGYLTDSVVVVHTTAADATLVCKTAERLAISSYTVVPVLPDGTGVDCG